MSSTMILLTPLLVLVLVSLFGFVGCSSFSGVPAEPEQTEVDPDPKREPDPDPVTPPVPTPAPPQTYQGLVTNTKGFEAFWPLDETSGNVAAVVGPLSPSANGEYKSVTGNPPALGSYSLGKFGVKASPANTLDFAAEFAATEAFLEVPFVPSLNPTPMGIGFTIELWAKPDVNAGSDRGGLVSSHHFDSASSQQGYEIGVLKVAGRAHQQVYARVYGGAAATISEISVQPDDIDGDPSDWRHIVLKYEFVAGTGYVLRLRVRILNGAKVYSKESTTPILYEQVTSAKSSTLRFGGTHLPPPGTSALFAGQLDNIAIYDAPVPDSDLDAHYSFTAS